MSHDICTNPKHEMLRISCIVAPFNSRCLPQHRLGLSPRQLSTVTWPEVARRIVDVQKQTRLCIARDLSEVDVVARIMRKENYLIGLLNKVRAVWVPHDVIERMSGRACLKASMLCL